MTTNDTPDTPDVDPDTQSDPAEADSEADREDTDWSSEGGATTRGPATHTESDSSDG